jgi:transcriptional regulator with XRE-family HTH domain
VNDSNPTSAYPSASPQSLLPIEVDETTESIPLPLRSLSLAQRVRTLREEAHLSLEAIAHQSQLPLGYLEDIEAGLELILPVANRQRLARALRISSEWLFVPIPDLLAQDPLSTGPTGQLLTAQQAFQIYQTRLPLETMAQNPNGFWPCPQCGKALQVRLYDRENEHGACFTLLRLDCTVCLFRLEDEQAA